MLVFPDAATTHLEGGGPGPRRRGRRDRAPARASRLARRAGRGAGLAFRRPTRSRGSPSRSRRRWRAGPPSSAPPCIRTGTSRPGRWSASTTRTSRCRRSSPPSVAKLVRVDAQLPVRRIGYVMGSGDEVPAVLRQLGDEVTLLDDDDLETADLDALRRDRRRRARLQHAAAPAPSAQDRLLDWVRAGGTLVVQYKVSRGLVDRPARAAAAQARRATGSRTRPRRSCCWRPPPAAHDAQPDRRRRLRRLGAGARAVLRESWDERVPRRCSPSPTPARSRAPARCSSPGTARALRLHRPRVLPPAPGRRARRDPAVRQPAGAGRTARDGRPR